MKRLLPFVRRWGISLYSLVAGVLALFIFRRGLPHVGLIVGYLLLLWLLLAVLVQVRDTLREYASRARRVLRGNARPNRRRTPDPNRIRAMIPPLLSRYFRASGVDQDYFACSSGQSPGKITRWGAEGRGWGAEAF